MVPSRSTAMMASGSASRSSLESRNSTMVFAGSEAERSSGWEDGRKIQVRNCPLNLCRTSFSVKRRRASRVQVIELTRYIHFAQVDCDCHHTSQRQINNALERLS